MDGVTLVNYIMYVCISSLQLQSDICILYCVFTTRKLVSFSHQLLNPLYPRCPPPPPSPLITTILVVYVCCVHVLSHFLFDVTFCFI